MPVSASKCTHVDEHGVHLPPVRSQTSVRVVCLVDGQHEFRQHAPPGYDGEFAENLVRFSRRVILSPCCETALSLGRDFSVFHTTSRCGDEDVRVEQRVQPLVDRGVSPSRILESSIQIAPDARFSIDGD